MKTILVLVGFLLLANTVAQQHGEPRANGVIYGTVIGKDVPVKRIGLTARPLGGGLSAAIPHTKTNDIGEYRFENLPWWGRYTVYAEDEEAAYSSSSTGAESNSHPAEVEVTPEHREAELTIYLPPKAGFLQIHLTNRKTGAGIPVMQVRSEADGES